MAFSLSSKARKGSASRYRMSSSRPISEINVTPFVDVMLVLLVIFMVTAPLLTAGVEIDLPRTKARALAGSDEPLVISVNSEGLVFIQETAVDLETLVPRLLAITGSNPDARIFIRGDTNIHYGRVMEVMSTISSAGYKKVGLVSASPSSLTKLKQDSAIE